MCKPIRRALLCCCLLLSALLTPCRAETAAFELLGSFTAPGGIKGAALGPGPAKDSRLLYLDYMYYGYTIEVVAVDPATGATNVLPNPVPTQDASYGLIQGPDGNMYMGTVPGAHLYRLNTQQQKLEDAGIPVRGETHIWSLAVARDGRIYGVTYPHCKLFSYDPKTQQARDLGRMDEQEKYARFVVTDGSDFLYVSTGTVHYGVVAYNIATGSARKILSDPTSEFYYMYNDRDGKAYAVTNHTPYLLKDGTATKLPTGTRIPASLASMTLPDGSLVAVSSAHGENYVELKKNGKTVASRPYRYAGRPFSISRLITAPDGTIYGGSTLPLNVFRLDVKTRQMSTLDQLGGGELYSLLVHDGKLLLAGYAARSILMSYDPAKPGLADNAAGSNPVLATYAGADSAWRPKAMIEGPGTSIYVGAVAGYGKLGGTLAVWDIANNQVQAFDNLIPDQSIVSLARANGLIYGGTSIDGGGGSTATQKDAVLFAFDPNAQKITARVIPVAGARTITDLVFAPNGRLFGFSDRTLFEYTPAARQLRRLATVDYGNLIYNSIAAGPGGNLYGLASRGVFRLNPESGEIRLLAESPKPITAGGALLGNSLYFASGADVYRYLLQ